MWTKRDKKRYKERREAINEKNVGWDGKKTRRMAN